MLKFMRFLTAEIESPPPPKQGRKRCSECNKECPLANFIRKATLSQTRVWTKNPTAQKRLKYEGKICNACHNAHRLNAMDMSPETYRKRLVSEGLNPLKVQARVETRRLRGIINRKEKGGKTRLKNLMPELQPMFDEIHAIEKKLANKMVHFKRTEEDESAAAVFCASYLTMLESIEQQIKIRAKTRQKIPTDWRDLITDVFVVSIWDLFREVAPKHTQRLAPFMQHIPRTPDL